MNYLTIIQAARKITDTLHPAPADESATAIAKACHDGYIDKITNAALSGELRIFDPIHLEEISPASLRVAFNRGGLVEMSMLADWLYSRGVLAFDPRLRKSTHAVSLGEIVLPANTKTVDFSKAPQLIAEAIHPNTTQQRAIVSGLLKTPIETDSIPAQRPQTLSEDDRELLNVIWRDLPAFSEGMPFSEWSRYEVAFERARYKPDWRLLALQSDAPHHTKILQINAANRHRYLIEEAVEKGELIAYDSALIPLVGRLGPRLLDTKFLVDDFARYVSRFPIDVRIATSVQQPAIESSPSLMLVDQSVVRSPAPKRMGGHSDSENLEENRPPIKNNARKDAIASLIEQAITAVKCDETALIFVHLRELALTGTPPFTGVVEEDAIFYTSEHGPVEYINLKNLGKRLARRRERATKE